MMADEGKSGADAKGEAPHGGGMIANTVREVTGPVRGGISSTAQIIVAAIGAVGTVCGAMIAAHKFDRPASSPTPAPTVSFSTYSPTPAPSVAGPAIQIGGSWVGPDGQTIVQFQQNGANIDVGSTYTRPDGQQGQLRGQGMVQGQQAGWSYQNTEGDSGACGANIAPDQAHLQGMCRHAQGPDFQIFLTRQS